MKNNSYFSTMNAIESMAQQTFVNQKLDFVEELVLFTDSHIFPAAEDLQAHGRGGPHRCGRH